jgi:hypothetical protein
MGLFVCCCCHRLKHEKEESEMVVFRLVQYRRRYDFQKLGKFLDGCFFTGLAKMSSVFLSEPNFLVAKCRGGRTLVSEVKQGLYWQ